MKGPEGQVPWALHPEKKRPEGPVPAGSLYECHGHLMMDGDDFTKAWRKHGGGAHFSNVGVHNGSAIDEAAVRSELAALRDSGIVYFRDGGDALGISSYAKTIAEDYGIDYVTPEFAIHRNGRYGGIVGRGYGSMEEYRQLLRELQESGGDFVKLMISGIITFKTYGGLSCPSLDEAETREVIAVAHEAGYAVMVHINGAEAVKAAIRAGVDSIEHAYFCDEEALQMLAESDTIWVPTMAAIEAFVGRDGFDEKIARQTLEGQLEAVRKAAALGAKIASGSDSGAVGVPHGPGTAAEYRLLAEAGVKPEQILAANQELRKRFRR